MSRKTCGWSKGGLAPTHLNSLTPISMTAWPASFWKWGTEPPAISRSWSLLRLGSACGPSGPPLQAARNQTVAKLRQKIDWAKRSQERERRRQEHERIEADPE